MTTNPSARIYASLFYDK